MRRARREGGPVARPSWAAARYWRDTDARAALATHRASGLSLAGFARRHGLTVQRLRWWRQRLTRTPPASATIPAAPRWLPVELLPAPAGGPAALLEVVVRGGQVIRVPAAFDPAVLRRVVAVLETETPPC